MILEVTFSGRPGSAGGDPTVEHLGYSPTWVKPSGFVIRDLAARSPGRLPAKLGASWGRTTGLLGDRPGATRPLAPVLTALEP